MVESLNPIFKFLQDLAEKEEKEEKSCWILQEGDIDSSECSEEEDFHYLKVLMAESLAQTNEPIVEDMDEPVVDKSRVQTQPNESFRRSSRSNNDAYPGFSFDNIFSSR